MSTRPPWLPGGATGILLILILLVIVAALILWARSAHPPGSANPAATGVPPTAPAKAAPSLP
ncbi:MAG: hypothetical protein QOH81_550 [Sphingomonadales bacterium]|jgi:hypothetical protein|nr:hypothetical protein [Sphingomonadales bacterium]